MSDPRKNEKARKDALDRKVDEEVEETFPASDPPAFMGNGAPIGAPTADDAESRSKSDK